MNLAAKEKEMVLLQENLRQRREVLVVLLGRGYGIILQLKFQKMFSIKLLMKCLSWVNCHLCGLKAWLGGIFALGLIFTNLSLGGQPVERLWRWVAPTTGASYMVITTNLIDGNWRLRKLIIGFKHVSHHKGKTICNVLLKCLAEWGIRKLFTITVDNATANTNAFEIVRDGLHELDASVAAVHNGVQHVREKVHGNKRKGPPSSDDWDELARLVKFVVVLYNSTLVASASSTVSSYKCDNEIVTIERNLIALSKKPDEKLRKKAKAMRDKYDKYWGGLKKINKMLIIASVFDPRNKMKFASLCFEALYGKEIDATKELLKLVNAVLEELFEEYNNAQTKERLNRMILDMKEGIFYTKRWWNTSSELELCLKEKVKVVKSNPLGIPFDVLGWWRTNSSKYPVLSAIARDLLAMQVSSVASESAFSNRIVTTHELLSDIEIQDKLQRGVTPGNTSQAGCDNTSRPRETPRINDTRLGCCSKNTLEPSLSTPRDRLGSAWKAQPSVRAQDC
ncbi:unnamed protein product [Arabidopsis thaliana]|uniref:(thale cress) hypothetical protein n=1 Tax=Arabidopsis thaliana TaxID=3702 RepID=A0A7G2EYR9_ARATH|nr:unnamed protein product [Arabidopsis thaliana]